MNLPPASNVSAAFRAANPHLYASVHHDPNPRQDAPVERHLGHAPLEASQVQGGATGRVLVRVTSIRRRLADEDGLCEKYHVDCCRYAGLLRDDSPEQTEIQTRQRKAAKGEEEHTLIEIIQP